MEKITPVDASLYSFDIHQDLSVKPALRGGGPPQRIAGMTMGILTMEGDAPHDGEIHPDGDEILYVISGRLEVSSDTNPGERCVLNPGDACIVSRGEWHQVHVMEKTQLIHVTPGPNGSHRIDGKEV